MKLVQLFFTGVLVIGMQMHAAEFEAPPIDGKFAEFLAKQQAEERNESQPGAPVASQQSSSQALSVLSTPSATESSGVELASSSESSQEAALSPKSSQQRHLGKPPRLSNIKEKIKEDFNQIKNVRIPQFQDRSLVYRNADCIADGVKVKSARTELNRCEKSEERDEWIAEANKLIKELDAIQTSRGGEVTDRVLRENEESEAGISALDDSQENDEEVTQATTSTPSKNYVTPRSKQIFAWIFSGTVAFAAVATIVYYLWYNKPPVLQHK